jgi:uncharacterized protein (TIGR02246 family)
MTNAAGRFEDAIEDCLDRIRAAWNAGDARAFAGSFTEDATYVIYLGEALIGRAEIEANHVEVFTKWQKGTRMAVAALRKTPLGDDAAVVLTAGGIGTGDSVPYDKLQTFTMVRREGRWLCAAFQNTKMSLQAERRYNLAWTASG